MLFTLTTTHMPAIGWRLCVDGVEIVWRCTCAIRWTPTRPGRRPLPRGSRRETSRHADLRARVSRHHMPHCREDLARRAYRDLRGLLGWKQLDQQVEGDLPVDLADLQVTDIRDDVVPDHIAVFLARSDSPRGMQEALFAELRDRHLGLPTGSARRGVRTTGATFKLQDDRGGLQARVAACSEC